LESEGSDSEGAESDTSSDDDEADPEETLRQQKLAERATYIFLKWMDSRGRSGRGMRHTPSTHAESENAELEEEVMKRAGEMCAIMQLKGVARRQVLRYGKRRSGFCVGAAEAFHAMTDALSKASAEAESPKAQPEMKEAAIRQAVTEDAQRFNMAYAEGQEVMRGHMTTKRPVRGNTGDIGEVSHMMATTSSRGGLSVSPQPPPLKSMPAQPSSRG